MTTVRLSLVEFMDVLPVVGARVEASLTIFPMRMQDIPPGPGGPHKPTKTPVPDLDHAVDVPAQVGVTDSTGRVSFSYATFAIFRRLRDESREPDPLIRARLNLGIAHAGYRRDLALLHGDIDDGDVLDRTVVIDHAKTIVGHTTTDETTLWFALHDDVRSGDEYVCEIAPTDGSTPRRLPVRPIAAAANTATVMVTGLRPGTSYTYRLLHNAQPPVITETPAAPPPRVTSTAGAGTPVASGRFTTARASRDRLDVVFTSCHLPNVVTSLNRWQHLANRDDYDLLLLMGDQIYEDHIERLGTEWFERYVNRYHQFWTPWVMREVLRRTPTYMIFDDHDVRDDWGTVPFDPDEEAGREAAALRAYELFQKAHGPGGGVDRPTQHYDFVRGPAAFFVLDARTNRVAPPPESLDRKNARWPDAPASTILGARQLADLRAWARSDRTREHDVIFLVSPVPLAFLPVQEVLRLVEELEDDSAVAGGIFGAIAGAVAVAIGIAVAGPAGGFVGGIIGGALVGGGAYYGHSEAASKIEDAGLDVLTDSDMADLWTWEPHQPDMVAVLDVLLDLANDVQPDGSLGPRPRAVFVLSGDVHTGAMHVISSDTTKNPQHRRQPLVYQMIGSPISKTPAPGGVFAQALKHIRPGLDVSVWKLVTARGDFEEIADDVFGDEAAHFPLDDRLGSRYRTEIVDVATGRNYSRIQLERVRGRLYRFFVTIEGEQSSVSRAFELDLDADPVAPKEVFGAVLAVEGRITMLRLNDLGHGFGPPTDRIDGEVIVALDRAPEQAFGFTLRDDRNEAAHRGMLDTLRSALAADAKVRLIYVRTGLHNGRLVRVHRVN